MSDVGKVSQNFIPKFIRDIMKNTVLPANYTESKLFMGLKEAEVQDMLNSINNEIFAHESQFKNRVSIYYSSSARVTESNDKMSLSSLNLAFVLGQKGTGQEANIEERYIGFKFGVVFSPSNFEKWFRKRKLD